MAHFLKGVALGFGVDEEDHEELHSRKYGKDDEGHRPGVGGDYRKAEGDDGVHDPVRGAAETLALGADVGGEDLGDVDPDDRALGDREEHDEGDKERQQQRKMLAAKKDIRHTGEAERVARGSDQEQSLAAELVDDGDAEQGGEQVGGTDGDGLQVGGDVAEAG